MKMTEIVSYLDLSVFPSVALIFFLAAFIAVIWNVMTRSKQEIEAAANIPLDDDVVFTPRIPFNSTQETLTHSDPVSEDSINTDKGGSRA